MWEERGSIYYGRLDDGGEMWEIQTSDLIMGEEREREIRKKIEERKERGTEE